MTPAERLRDILAESGLTIAAFADACGVEERTVQRWLAGTIPASRVRWLLRVHVWATRNRVHLEIARE